MNLAPKLIVHNREHYYYPSFREQVKMPSSHKLKIKLTQHPDLLLNYYLIHVIGFYFKQWIMPSSYWFDGAINFGGKFNNETPSNMTNTEDLENFLELAIDSFSGVPVKCKYRNTIISALYSYNSCHKYRWEHEWFLEFYKSFDALWQYSTQCLNENTINEIHKSLEKEKSNKHKNRLMSIYEFLKIPDKKIPKAILDTIFTIRNAMIHEARWNGEILGHKPSDQKTFDAVIYFQVFVRRFLKYAITQNRDFNFHESNIWEI